MKMVGCNPQKKSGWKTNNTKIYRSSPGVTPLRRNEIVHCLLILLHWKAIHDFSCEGKLIFVIHNMISKSKNECLYLCRPLHDSRMGNSAFLLILCFSIEHLISVFYVPLLSLEIGIHMDFSFWSYTMYLFLLCGKFES